MLKSRREFMSQLSVLGFTAALPSMARLAVAQSANDYKALICLFMRGGNDANNMIIPLNSASQQLYASYRGALALPPSSLLPLGFSGYAIHPSMKATAQAFGSGNVAVVTNVGPLVQPTTKAQFNTAGFSVPDGLMSHANQQETWESGGWESGVAPGWGGFLADQLGSKYNPTAQLPMVSLLGSATNFGVGRSTAPFSMNPGAMLVSTWCSTEGCDTRTAGEVAIAQLPTTNPLVLYEENIVQAANTYNNYWDSILPTAPTLHTKFDPSNNIASALQSVVAQIQLQRTIGAQRQVFLINCGSFDTHGDQLNTQAALLAEVDAGIATFISAMQELGRYDQVTLFTASDFSRTFIPNTAIGTDHAWGSHHLVVGGAVKGGQLYGTFPELNPQGASDATTAGVWIPTTAVSQYCATLASWFGVTASALPSLFPGLSNFSQATLSFI